MQATSEVGDAQSAIRFRTIMSDLGDAFAQMRLRHKAGVGISLGDLLHSFGPSGTALSCLVLALPFVSPFSLGPITTPASVTIFLLGLHLCIGRDGFPIPARYLNLPLPQWIFQIMRRMVLVLGRWRGWHRVRVHDDVDVSHSQRRLMKLSAVGIVLAALLLAVPIPMLPLTNTFPALAIIAFSVAHIGRTRLDFFLGVGLTLLSVIVFLILGLVFFYLGMEGVRQLHELIFAS